MQGGWTGLGTVFFTSCRRLSHGRHQGNSARYDGSTRLQVGHWYLPHLMVSKTPRWVCGCQCVCCVQTPTLKAKHRGGAQMVALL